jgi:methane/ammonia monooxygenase subunit A
MKTSQSAVVSRTEEVNVSRTFDWMILFSLFLIVLSGYHINYLLTGEEWDLCIELKTIFH